MTAQNSSLDFGDVSVGELPQHLADAYYATEAGDVCTLITDGALGEQTVRDLVIGAGFVVRPDHEIGECAVRPSRSSSAAVVEIERIVSLPDRLVPDLRIWFSGLNPSIYAAEVGVGFARPGNRFWPAALASGLMTVDRDPYHALVHHRVGMTDLVKRATVKANELSREEFVAGAERLRRLCVLFAPRVLCVAGITGWRAAVDKRAVAGLQPEGFGDTQIYVMANPSGLNAHVTVHDIADELGQVAALADARD